MRVITFYSYKGGVGRTLACANFGLYLAKTGQKVVLADMDFEAPGLDSKFSTVNPSHLQAGLLDQFTAFQGGRPLPEISSITIPLPDDVTRSGGSLQMIPAGNYLSPDYYPNLSNLNWQAFLGEETGLAFCIDLVKRIERTFGADVLVIDSRTGLTEVGGLCTQVLPDMVLLFTCTSPESLTGTRRIYDRIRNSPVVKKRLHGRDRMDLRIVITRIPRPESLPEFDESMKKRLGIEVERLYYLFEERDLSLEEYLALDRFAEEHPPILDDYVELFASFHSETTLPYIEKRLEAFRLGVTRRPPYENERLIKELLTLFPRPEVFLEAARYYRLAKGGDSQTVTNYLRYLAQRANDSQVISEFAEVCSTVPETELKPREDVAMHLRRFGPQQMHAKLLERYSRLIEDKDDLRSVVAVIEQDDAKLQAPNYRTTYFHVLHTLGEWQKIVATASVSDARSRPIGLLIAEAHAGLGNLPEVFKIVRHYPRRDPEDILVVLRLLYRVMPDADVERILAEMKDLDPSDLVRMLRHPRYMMGPREADPGFIRWVHELSRQLEKR